MDDVTDVDNVRLEQLMEWIPWFAGSCSRGDRPVFDSSEPMRNEPLSSQFSVYVPESRLISVKRYKRDLGLNRDATRELCPAIDQNRQLGPLHIHFQEIDWVKLVEIIEPSRGDLLGVFYPAPFRKEIEEAELRGVRFEQGIHAEPLGTDVQGMLTPIAKRIRENGSKITEVLAERINLARVGFSMAQTGSVFARDAYLHQSPRRYPGSA